MYIEQGSEWLALLYVFIIARQDVFLRLQSADRFGNLQLRLLD